MNEWLLQVYTVIWFTYVFILQPFEGIGYAIFLQEAFKFYFLSTIFLPKMFNFHIATLNIE